MENKYGAFKQGILDGLPICLGYLSVSFAFGIFTVNSGLGIFDALIISLTNVTSAGQLAAVPLIVSQSGLFELISTEFVINLRYALMSVTLSQKLGKDISFLDRFWIAFMNTDEIFAMATSHKEDVNRKYMFGLILTPYFGWAIGTFLGAVAGDILPEMLTSALGIAIYGMFIAIVTPVAREDKKVFFCVLLTIFVSCFCHYMLKMDSGFAIIVSSITASFVMTILVPEDNL